MSAGRNSQGSRVYHSGPGSPSSYGEIEQVSDITGPDGSSQQIDTTHLRSTGKEYLPGLADFGQIQLTCNYVAGTKQIDLFNNFVANSDPEPFRLKAPTSSTQLLFDQFDFLAIVTKWTLGLKVNDKQALTITLKITGTVVYTANQS